jgi:DNA adenine methylase
MAQLLSSPYSYFGGKGKVAPIIWERFLTGDAKNGGRGKCSIDNFIDPFGGSMAVLLARPASSITSKALETVNDYDCYISNFWRAIQSDPDGVADHADYPVMEADLVARSNWLSTNRESFRQKVMSDPEFYDTKVAGWWVYGISHWIGGGFATGMAGKKLPKLSGKGSALAGRRYESPDAVAEWFRVLSERLRNVRVTCGDWSECLGPSVSVGNGVTGIVLDPPYIVGAEYYAAGKKQAGRNIAEEVRQWATQMGECDQSKAGQLKMVLCGYEDDKYPMPDNWITVKWKARGGFGNQGKVEREEIDPNQKAVFGTTVDEMEKASITSQGEGRINAGRERLWFSPGCAASQDDLFSMLSHEEDLIEVA